MKLGITLPSHFYTPERRRLADAAFRSLAATESLQEPTTLLLLVRRGTAGDYTAYTDQLNNKFRLIIKTDEGLEGTEQTLAFGTTYLAENFDLDYLMWMGDDALFHPFWLWKLEGLISRHLAAKAWSVYRSAHEAFHAPIRQLEDDMEVRSICGHGMTFSVKEWKAWGIKWQQGAWLSSRGDTMDLLHVEARPGERWVTKHSYLQHTGKVGRHCTGNEPEYAQEYAG